MISSEWAEIQDFPNDVKYKKEKQVGSRHENVELNRYNDIVAYDQTCVKLKKVNYINANWIECKWTGQKYIATQGTVFFYSFHISELFSSISNKTRESHFSRTKLFNYFSQRSKRNHVSSLLANDSGAQYWRHCDVVSTARNAQRARKRKMPQVLAR